MELSQPGSGIPPSMEKAVADAKNLLTLTEQEVIRLRGLAKDQESIVRGLLDKQAIEAEVLTDLENKRIRLLAEVVGLEEKISDRKILFSSLQEKIDGAESLVQSVNDVKSKLDSILSLCK